MHVAATARELELGEVDERLPDDSKTQNKKRPAQGGSGEQ
jgi:hypothetical protein